MSPAHGCRHESRFNHPPSTSVCKTYRRRFPFRTNCSPEHKYHTSIDVVTGIHRISRHWNATSSLPCLYATRRQNIFFMQAGDTGPLRLISRHLGIITLRQPVDTSLMPTKQQLAYENLCSGLAANGVWFRCMSVSELVNNHGYQYPSYRVRTKWRVSSLSYFN